MVEILMKKLEGKMFKVMHHYMGLLVDDYIKTYNERILDLVDLVREKQTRVMSITLANLITLDVHNENAMKNLLVKAEDENKLYSACICSLGGGQGIQKTCDICQNRNI